MHARQFEQLARQRTDELASVPFCGLSQTRANVSPPGNGGIRNQAGWAIVAIGLRIAEAGTR